MWNWDTAKREVYVFSLAMEPYMYYPVQVQSTGKNRFFKMYAYCQVAGIFDSKGIQ